MTPREMPAGRALDAEVAEKVMGLAVVGAACCVYVDGDSTVHVDSDPEGWACDVEMGPVCVERCMCDLGPALITEPEDDEDGRFLVREYNAARTAEFESDRKRFGHSRSCLAPVPRYSTDIAAAWTVVEKLSGFDGHRERPWWSVAVFHAQKNQVMAVVYANEPGWRVDNTDERIAEGHGWTAPEAICRAALAALAACGQDVRRVPIGRDAQPCRCGGTEET